MGSVALPVILSGLLLGAFHGSEDDTSEDIPETPENPELADVPDTPDEPEITGDFGASFSATRTDVEIELGEDETGSLAVAYYEDTEDASEFFEVVEARFYLVPEETDWSTAT